MQTIDEAREHCRDVGRRGGVGTRHPPPDFVKCEGKVCVLDADVVCDLIA